MTRTPTEQMMGALNHICNTLYEIRYGLLYVLGVLIFISFVAWFITRKPKEQEEENV